MTQIDTTSALVELEEVKAWLDIKASDKDNWFQQLINRVSADCAAYCDRTLISATYTDAEYDGTGSDTLVLPHYPVSAITALKASINGAALTEGREEDFVFDSDTGIVTLIGGTFSKEKRGVTITYTAGYTLANVPQDLKQAVLEAIAFRYMEMDRKRVGVTSQEAGQQRSYYTTEPYPEHVRQVWDRYTKKDLR
jgi:uncharacterized phiE125 gp8 family phage protein